MMKKNGVWQLCVVGMIWVGLFMVGLGCDRTETDRSMTVSPSNARLLWQESITFTVSLPDNAAEDRELYYPLEWSVSDPSMGYLQRIGGDSVVYVAARRSGPNSILVRDPFGAEGVASIVQEQPVEIGD